MRNTLAAVAVATIGAIFGAIIGGVIDILIRLAWPGFPAGTLMLGGLVVGGWGALQWRKFH